MAAKQARIMHRISVKARDNLRLYAVRLSYERDRRVSMAKALDEILLAIPFKKRTTA